MIGFPLKEFKNMFKKSNFLYTPIIAHKVRKVKGFVPKTSKKFKKFFSSDK